MKKILKNIICITIVLVMGLTSMSFAFSDTENHWGKEYIDLAAELGIIDGFEDGTYKPNNILTREQFAKILVVALNIEPAEDDVIDFLDITDGRWSEKYVEASYKYLTGYKFGDGYIFKPSEPAVREDVAVAVVKAKGLDKKEANLKLLDQFSDKDKISEDLRKYVALAVEYGIMQGKGGYFDPQGSLTRAEGATLIIKSLDKVVIDDEVEEDDTLLEDVQFAAFKNEIAAVKDMVTVAMNNAKGEEALRGNTRSNAQLYNFIARGGKNVLTYNDEGDKKWLVQSDAASIPCTKIEEQYAKDVLGAKLPTRYIETYKNQKEYYSYFVTPKGEVFCWPPYEYDGKSYVNERTIVTNKSGTKLNVLEATKKHDAYIHITNTNEKIIVSNETGLTAIELTKNLKLEDGIGVWYSKANKIEGIDFSEYNNNVYYGDVNNDGRVDYEDEDALYDVIYGTKPFTSINQHKTDINYDGKVSELDYLILQNYLGNSSNKITTFPHGCRKFTIKFINNSSIDEEIEHRKVYYCECGITLLKLIEDHEFINNKCECGYEKEEKEPEKPKKDYEGTIYEEAILELYERGITAFFEDGNYLPEKQVTRAEFAKLLVIEEGLENIAIRDITDYIDVPKSHWASGYINVATEYGFIAGYPDGTFKPDEPVTYAEAITYVLRTLGYKTVVEAKGTWPTNYITKANELNLLDDMNYKNYNDKATRGNVAILIYNMLSTKRWVTNVAIIGDVNHDNNVDAFDASLVLKYIAKESNNIDKALADVNEDGMITEEDAKIILAYDVKKIDKLPHKCKFINRKCACGIEEKIELQYGDVNGDGEITEEDAMLLFQYSMLPDVYEDKVIDEIDEYGDVNQDGELDTRDSSIIKAYVDGKIDELPHECELIKGKCECGYEEEPKTDYEGTDYEEAILELYERGIVNFYEDGNFGINKLVTRAEFAKLLVLEEGLEPAADVARGETVYSDVSKNHWASGYINVATEYGFMTGYPDETFKPDETITYAEAITDVLRTLGYGSVIENKGTWPTNYITKAQEMKLLADMDYRSYSDKATRGNIAILVYNMLDAKRWEVKVIVTGDVNLDGQISGKDYNALSNYLNGKTNLSADAKLNADVNLDNVVDDNDLTILKAFNLKLINKLPHKCKITTTYSISSDLKHTEMIECDCGEIDYMETLNHTFINNKCECGAVK